MSGDRAVSRSRDGQPGPQANFKHSLAALEQHFEGLLLRHSTCDSETLERISARVGTGRRKRRTLRPVSRWDRRRDRSI